MKSVLVSAWLHVAAWAGFHGRTHPAFSGQALSMVGVSCKRSRSVAIHEARLGRFCCRIPEKFFTFSLSFVQNRLCENSPMAKKYCALPNVARLFQNAEPLSRRPRLCMTSSRHVGATPIEGRSTPSSVGAHSGRADGIDAALDGVGGGQVAQYRHSSATSTKQTPQKGSCHFMTSASCGLSSLE